MSLLNVYSIYDKVSNVANKPFVEVNDASAIRAFIDSGKRSPYIIDYELLKVGTFNQDNGELVPLSPVRIYSGLDAKKKLDDVLPAHLQEQAE